MKAFLIFAVCFIICASANGQLAGGIKKGDPKDPQYKALVQHGLDILNAGEAKDGKLTWVFEFFKALNLFMNLKWSSYCSMLLDSIPAGKFILRIN